MTQSKPGPLTTPQHGGLDAGEDVCAGDRVIVFRRGALHFCLPVDAVVEVVRGAGIQSAPGAQGVVGFAPYRDAWLTTVDPAAAIGASDGAECGTVIVIGTGRGLIALVADKVDGLRAAERIAGAQWLGGAGPVVASAMIEEVGHAYVLSPRALAVYPTSEVDARATEAPAEAETGGMFLTFTIGDDRFAAAFQDIERILHERRAWNLPGGLRPLRRVVEANGTVIPVLDMPGDRADADTGSYIVLRSEMGPVALRIDTIDRPQRLSGNAGDSAWFAGAGVTGLAQGRSLAFRVVTGPALLQGAALAPPDRT